MSGSTQDKGKGRASQDERGNQNTSMVTHADASTMSSPSGSYLSGIAASAISLVRDAFNIGSGSRLEGELSGWSATGEKGESSSRLPTREGSRSEMIPRTGQPSSALFKKESTFREGRHKSGVNLSAADTDEQRFLRMATALWGPDDLSRSDHQRGQTSGPPTAPRAYSSHVDDGAAVCALLSDPRLSPLDDTVASDSDLEDSHLADSHRADSVKKFASSAASEHVSTQPISALVELLRSYTALTEKQSAQQSLSHSFAHSKSGTVVAPTSQTLLSPRPDVIAGRSDDELDEWQNLWKNYTERVWGDAPNPPHPHDPSSPAPLSAEEISIRKSEEKGTEPARETSADMRIGGQNALDRLRLMSGHLM